MKFWWSPGVGIWLTMETQGWGNWHLKTWKCQISRGLPGPPILGQTIDRCIRRSKEEERIQEIHLRRIGWPADSWDRNGRIWRFDLCWSVRCCACPSRGYYGVDKDGESRWGFLYKWLRRLWAAHIKRKWRLFPFNIPWYHYICIAKCLYCYKMMNHCPRMQTVDFRLICVSQKR